ncbi:helicase-related protein, partial [Campylobacter jejuni]|uniref:helicase-related protein n=1 Tax=Campylobacter jejuni TaxID=197 RepID=UPI003364D75B
ASQVDMLFDEAKKVIQINDRVLVTGVTREHAEDLTRYYLELGIKVKYIHWNIGAIGGNKIIKNVRSGANDMLIGISLLREGLD